jgi:phenylpropionate dioxygenase-like ring-hydroxylating dioxygenase large terminal subunit
MYIKNDWYMAAWAAEVTDKPMARKIANEPIMLYRDSSGRVAALQDRCCHRGVALSLGRVVEEGIECGYHGMVFNRNGQCVRIPGQDSIPSKACVRHYAVEEKDSIIWLWLGDPSVADRSLIIDYPWHGDAKKWPHKESLIHVKCDYTMLLANIMDLTHLAYVHRKTIGGSPNAHANALMNTERTPKGVRFTRWLLDSPPPPTYLKAANFPGNVDRWQELELTTPCSIVQFTGGVDVSQDAYHGGSREGGFAMRVLHCIVPETETTCHYFYSVANGWGQDNPATTEIAFNQIEPTLLEDKVFCENQQTIESEYPGMPTVDIKSDEARVIFARQLQRRLAEEQAAMAKPA